MKNRSKHSKSQRIWALIIIGLLTLHISCTHSARKTGKLSYVSVEEELELGQTLLLQAEKQFKIVRDEAVTQYLQQLTTEIARQSDWSGLQFTTFLINSPDINHFSLPGGNIFIFRGLLQMCETTGELAGILAHEIAHICARDGVDRIAEKYGFAFAAQTVMGTNPEIPIQIIQNLYNDGTILDYSSKAELRADRKAVLYMYKANWDPKQYGMILEKIRETEVMDSDLVLLLRATHPSISTRLRQVNREIDKAPAKSALRMEDAEFQIIKNIVEQIP